MLKNCRLYVIVDKGIAGNRDIAEIAEDALRGGADIIQLRDKSSSDSSLLRCGRKIKNIAKKYKRTFIINDRVDVARAVNADGVHLGQDDTSIDEARRIIGSKIIGISTHNVSQARKAQKSGADYIGVGPIFKTATKKKIRPIGLSVLRRVRKAVNIPFFAIGGISLANINEIKKSGTSRIAVVSAAIKTKNIRRSVKKLKDGLYDTVRRS